MKQVTKLIAVKGWMFGMELKPALLTLNEDGSITAEYNNHIGWMGRPTKSIRTFENINDYYEKCDKELTALYSNAYLTRDERIVLNEINMPETAWVNAFAKFRDKTAIEFLNKKITLAMSGDRLLWKKYKS